MTLTQNLLAKVEMNIDENREDSLRNHLFSKKYVLYGETSHDSFKLWKKTSWTGDLYYVVNGKIKEVGSKVDVTLETKMNSFGRVIRLLVFWSFCIGLVYSTLLPVIVSFEFLWKQSILILIALLVPTLVLHYTWRYEKRVFLKEVGTLLKST